jgi:hypothetical protein
MSDMEKTAQVFRSFEEAQKADKEYYRLQELADLEYL